MDLEMVLNTNTDKLIVDLRKDGYTLQEISSKTNVSYSYAQRLIKNLEKVLKN
jgi:DNA-binding MarR family transcriptional regulator